VKLSLERKIVLGFAAALVVLLLVTAAAWWNVARFRSTQYWVNHNREVLSRIEQTRGNILSMLASGRGFILTGSDEVLEPFHRGSTGLMQSMEELGRLVAADSNQQDRFTRLVPLVDKARTIMLGQIASRRAHGLNAAAETSAYLAGQRAVEAFGDVLREMAAAERRLLDDRLERVNRFGRFTIFALVGTSSLATGFVVMAARIVRSDLRRRQETERTLQESFRRVEDLYNRAPCGYHSLDESGSVIAINDTALQWLGLSREEVVNRMKFSDMLAPESLAFFQANFRSFKRSGSVTDIEYICRRKDGSQFPVLLNATAIYDAKGKYVSSRATVFNLTERKRVEAERDRFFVLSRDLLCIGGMDGYFRRVNPAWEQTLGHSRDELMARPYIEFVHTDDLERTMAQFERIAEGHETIAFENRFRCKDGSYRWLRWSARPDQSENLVYASAHDVTDQRASAERIQLLNADLANRALQLESANRELESFSYSVSHDLRAPLRHIDGFASLLTKRANAVLDTEARRYVATISKAAKQMGALIDDLLAFSRIGRVALCLETIRHEQLVADVIANGRFDSETRTIAWQIGPLPDVHGDAAMLRQVWANLIDNAVKYSSKVALPVITIGTREEADSSEHVFFIRDNGVGFDMAYAEKLFGVFQRLHSSTEFDGTGIGLANVRRIVTRHGGRVWAESRTTEGATFYFSLPRTVSSSGLSS
jgi:PAS domain S-box-containing protein